MDAEAVEEAIDFTLQTTETVTQVVEPKTPQDIPEEPTVTTIPEAVENLEQVYVADNGYLMLHRDHPEYLNFIRLQLENQELISWKNQLQAKIIAERTEYVRLKHLASTAEVPETQSNLSSDDPEYKKLIEHYMKENSLLEQKRSLLAKEVLDENISLIQLQVDVAMKQLVN